jgi:hypothetical protein
MQGPGAFLAVDKQVVAPDALCLADHPASIGSIPRDRERVFQQLLLMPGP